MSSRCFQSGAGDMMQLWLLFDNFLEANWWSNLLDWVCSCKMHAYTHVFSADLRLKCTKTKCSSMVLHLRWFCISNSPRTAVTFGVGNVRLSWSDVIRFIWSLYIWLLVANYLHVFCQDCIQRFCPVAFRRPVFSLARPGKLFACKWHRAHVGRFDKIQNSH